VTIDTGHQTHDSLDRSECKRLLGTATVGRLGVTVRGLPWVVPVRFVFDGARILVDVGIDPAIAAAARDAVVGFEADDIDSVTHERWSVMATGFAREVHWSWSEGHVTTHHDGGTLLANDPEIMTGWCPAVMR
jgi:nitroimidazol reductase NimA-like FMN-containing flavoprotein (pyridoxamine 5'-phosphate oxidase superfamily)